MELFYLTGIPGALDTHVERRCGGMNTSSGCMGTEYEDLHKVADRPSFRIHHMLYDFGDPIRSLPHDPIKTVRSFSIAFDRPSNGIFKIPLQAN